MNSIAGLAIHDITIPNYNTALKNIYFTATVGTLQLVFDMLYRDNRWICYVTFPGNKIRLFSLFPRVMQWGSHKDYTIALISDDLYIDDTNLEGQIIRLYVWKV